jgi:hypothetical protein
MTWRELVERLRAFPFFEPRQSDWTEAIYRHREPGMSRRTFLRAAGVAAATIALLPDSLALDEVLLDWSEPCGIDVAALDALLREVYLPLITAELNRTNPLMQLLSRDFDETPRGKFVVPLKVGS